MSVSSIDLTEVTTLTFDCYGTLIDWEAGVIDVLRQWLTRYGVVQSDDEIISTFLEIEAPLCELPYRSYRRVLEGVVETFGHRLSVPIEVAERQMLAASVASWRPFPDTVEVLRALRERYRLAIISNIDDDLFAATAPQLGVSFDCVLTAEEARCYKPDPGIFELALSRLRASGSQVIHIAEGATEIPPARQLGCATMWVRRRGRSSSLLTEAPDADVPDLLSLLPLLGASP